MKISINAEKIETIDWLTLKSGSLFIDPNVDDSPLYMRTNEGESIDLSNGEVTAEFGGGLQVIDVTGKYVIVDL